MFDGNAPAKTHARQPPTPQPHLAISTEIFNQIAKKSEAPKVHPANHVYHAFHHQMRRKNHQLPPIFRKTPPKNRLKKITPKACNRHTKKTCTAPARHEHKPPKPSPVPQKRSPASAASTAADESS
jgi:hypothetical protein